MPRGSGGPSPRASGVSRASATARRARPRSRCGRSGPLRPQSPRGGTWTSGTPARTACSRAMRSRSGQRVSRWSPSARNVRGSLIDERPAHRDDLGRIHAPETLAELALRMPGRGPAGRAAEGPRHHAPCTRWIVPRISASRTTDRSSSRSDSSSGPEVLDAGPQPDVGGVRRLRLQADQRLDDSREPGSDARAEQVLAVERRPVERARCPGPERGRCGADMAACCHPGETMHQPQLADGQPASPSCPALSRGSDG